MLLCSPTELILIIGLTYSNDVPEPKVQLEATLSTSELHSISLSRPEDSSNLKLVATIRIVSSAKPTSAVTLLTNYTIFDNSKSDALGTIHFTPLQNISQPDCTLALGPRNYPYKVRTGGDLDLRKRDNLKFITIPPLGQGTAKVEYDLSPGRIFRYSSLSIPENLSKIKPGETYRITTNSDGWLSWWIWGDLEGDLANKKFSRWQLPKQVPDDPSDLTDQLTDPVDLTDVNSLDSRSCVAGEEKPDVKRMLKEGWVFSENEEYIKLMCANQKEGALIQFVL